MKSELVVLFYPLHREMNSYGMNGPQRTAVSRKELWQKRKQKDFLNKAVKGQWTPS